MKTASRRRLSRLWQKYREVFLSENCELVKSVFNFGAMTVLLASCVCSSATELAILRNGNEIRHERHQVVGPVTRLYLSDSASGYIEIPTDQIERFELDKTALAQLPKSSFNHFIKFEPDRGNRKSSTARPKAQRLSIARRWTRW